MQKQIAIPAVMSKTLRFLAAGGMAMAAALVQEALRPHPDWVHAATILAGLALGVGGGAYGRVVAQGPITSILPGPRG